MVDTRAHDVLLLDFGGVCLLNPVELHSTTETLLGLAPGTLDWLGPIDPSTDELWRRMIAGDGVTERQYWTQRAQEVGGLAGVKLSRRDYMRLLYEPPRAELVRSEASQVVEQALADGYGVSVLTNDMRDFHGLEWEHGVPFLQRMDHIVDCSDTKIFKPDRQAFDRATEIVECPPERILFVDDQPLNVKGAEAAGMEAMWFDIANANACWLEVATRLGLG